MHTANLEQVGNSVMLVVPAAMLEALHLKAGSMVGLAITGNTLVVDPAARPRYTLTELLESSDYSGPRTLEEQEWVRSPAAGRELL